MHPGSSQTRGPRRGSSPREPERTSRSFEDKRGAALGQRKAATKPIEWLARGSRLLAGKIERECLEPRKAERVVRREHHGRTACDRCPHAAGTHEPEGLADGLRGRRTRRRDHATRPRVLARDGRETRASGPLDERALIIVGECVEAVGPQQCRLVGAKAGGSKCIGDGATAHDEVAVGIAGLERNLPASGHGQPAGDVPTDGPNRGRAGDEAVPQRVGSEPERRDRAPGRDGDPGHGASSPT